MDEDFTANPAKNGRAWSLQTIHSACLHTTLLALRDLDDVLTPRANQSPPDDLKICDFGFPHSLTFLTKSERRSINKKIAHSTLPGAELPSYRWDVFELLTKGRKANGVVSKYFEISISPDSQGIEPVTKLRLNRCRSNGRRRRRDRARCSPYCPTRDRLLR